MIMRRSETEHQVRIKIAEYLVSIAQCMGGGKLDYTVNMRRSETEHIK